MNDFPPTLPEPPAPDMSGNWAQRALELMDEADWLIRYGSLHAPKEKYEPAAAAFWQVAHMLAAESNRLCDQGLLGADHRLLEHAGTDGELAEALERFRLAHHPQWTVQEVATVSVAVRVLRELNLWRIARSEVAQRKQAAEQTALGDYVLATKWGDGDPGDPWGVGFYDGERLGRHFVKDSDGKQIRAGGFRRVGRITPEMGRWLLTNAAALESSPPCTVNLWGLLGARAVPEEPEDSDKGAA